MTVRKRILALLETGSFTVRELSSALGLREREVLDHLPHVSRSISPARRILISPAECPRCGFTFRKRSRFSTPSKCPKCRFPRIQAPVFTIAPGGSSGGPHKS